MKRYLIALISCYSIRIIQLALVPQGQNADQAPLGQKPVERDVAVLAAGDYTLTQHTSLTYCPDMMTVAETELFSRYAADYLD